ncbi:hypothetical protein TWF481_005914 [Arthrobotrys musiformis]|uniref:DUF4246 domain-containing protein n=1 Tax=Arthrobotrys musiformis TaxID=47236 RepID=A0AAV9WF63_9PEZI
MTGYPHPLAGPPASAQSFLDQAIQQFTANIRAKPNWMEKITDRKLMVKWFREAAAEDEKRLSYYDTNVIVWTTDVVKFVDKELKAYKAYIEKLREEGLCIEPDIDVVWKADGLIGEELRRELIDAVATLENVPEEQKDWHPGTDNIVLNLVHPSMWPVVYGRTVDVDGNAINCPPAALIPGNRHLAFRPEDDDDPYNSDDSYESYDGYDVDTYTRVITPSKADIYMNGWSKKFCWLPSEFEVSADGKSTHIASHINNLNGPGQKELFHPILEKIFSKFVPMFNHLLADLSAENHLRYRTWTPYEFTDYSRNESKRMILTEPYTKGWEELLEQYENGEELTVDFNAMVEEDYEDAHPDYELWDLGGVDHNRVWSPPNITDQIKLDGKTVKVIVKLANIMLTPEKPQYGGGSWHVEAMRNERIVATGIYYYSQENITSSELLFRRTVDVERNPGVQSSNWGIVHNMEPDCGVQELGNIYTTDNRAIVFPNVYQHGVPPFSLEDRTKPGHRKILVFFLCDPSNDSEIPSTKTIGPQQPDFRASVESALRSGRPGKLAEELFQMITKELPPTIPLEEAREYRAALMKERSNFTSKSSMVKGIEYNFCEH